MSQHKNTPNVDFLDISAFLGIYGRLCQALDVKTQREVAKSLGKTPQWLNNLLRAARDPDQHGKVRKIPLEALTEFSTKHDVDLHWLLTGVKNEAERGGLKAGHDQIKLPRGSPGPLEPEEKTLLEQALEVLRAPAPASGYSTALAQNITMFHQGVNDALDKSKSGRGGQQKQGLSKGAGSQRGPGAQKRRLVNSD